MTNHKGCWFIETAGRWSWKLKSAKECVITHLPNGPAPKIDDGQRKVDNASLLQMKQRVGGREFTRECCACVQQEVNVVQILVIVVNSCLRMATAYVDKGSEGTVVGFGLVGSKGFI